MIEQGAVAPRDARQTLTEAGVLRSVVEHVGDQRVFDHVVARPHRAVFVGSSGREKPPKGLISRPCLSPSFHPCSVQRAAWGDQLRRLV